MPKHKELQPSGAKKRKLAKVKADNELESDLLDTISFSDITDKFASARSRKCM